MDYDAIALVTEGAGFSVPDSIIRIRIFRIIGLTGLDES